MVDEYEPSIQWILTLYYIAVRVYNNQTAHLHCLISFFPFQNVLTTLIKKAIEKKKKKNIEGEVQNAVAVYGLN